MHVDCLGPREMGADSWQWNASFRGWESRREEKVIIRVRGQLETKAAWRTRILSRNLLTRIKNWIIDPEDYGLKEVRWIPQKSLINTSVTSRHYHMCALVLVYARTLCVKQKAFSTESCCERFYWALGSQKKDSVQGPRWRKPAFQWSRGWQGFFT